MVLRNTERIFCLKLNVESDLSLHFTQKKKKEGQDGSGSLTLGAIIPVVSEMKIFLRISACPYSVISLHSPKPCFIFWRIKISRTIFEMGHPRYISVIFVKIRPVVSEKKIFQGFLHVRVVHLALIHQSHVN